jgi:hypothetical protein
MITDEKINIKLLSGNLAELEQVKDTMIDEEIERTLYITLFIVMLIMMFNFII